MSRQSLLAWLMLPAFAVADDWVTVKGRVVWNKEAPIPKRAPLKADTDAEVAAKDKEFLSEDYVVNPKNRGIRDVAVWLAPEPTAAQLKNLQAGRVKVFPSFDPKTVHPALAKPAKPSVEIDQPCCRFIPHAVLAREGQDLIIKNSAPVPHNAKWSSDKNGEINPLIPAGGQYVVKNLVAERNVIPLACSIHRWMKAWVRVFDHPYYALTDEDGNFEIKNAPVLDGKLRLFVFQENGFTGGNEGRFGQTIEVKAGTQDLGELIYKGRSDDKK